MKSFALAALSCVLLPLSACAGEAASSERPTVLASVYPLEYVAQRVAGDAVEVIGLVAPGHEAHDAELSVDQTAAVTDADLVLRVEGLAPALDETVAEREDEVDVEALGVLQHRDPALGGARPVGVLEGDPHFWLDPRALATYAEEVAERLVALDPDNAEDYRENTVGLISDLNRLDGQLSSGLDDCERRTVVVSHEAYDYLGYRYDLRLESLVGLSPEDEPSPATLAALQELAAKEGVTTVFYEPLEGPAPVEGLARDLGLEIAALDPIEGLSQETEDEDYLSLMRANMDALVRANGCS